MRLILLAILLPILGISQSSSNGYSTNTKERMLDQVNELRKKGCYCGNKYMKPVGALKWSEVLFDSAYDHARDMSIYNYFSHISRKGLDIGDRVDKFGYKWVVVGENIGEGQLSFGEVLMDWKKSPEHCKMLMNPDVVDMAVAKFNDKWVQHFGKLRRYRYSRK